MAKIQVKTKEEVIRSLQHRLKTKQVQKALEKLGFRIKAIEKDVTTRPIEVYLHLTYVAFPKEEEDETT